MIDITPGNLLEEVLAAERLRDKHIDAFKEQVERFHGPWFNNSSTGEYVGENHYFEYLSLMVPRMVFDNPRVRVRSRATGAQAKVALAMRFALNNWISETKLRRHLYDMATDMLFNFGVLLVTEEVNKCLPSARPNEVPATPMWPVVSRIPQSRFFVDPAAVSMREARFMGHKWIRDKDDLLQMAKDSPEAGWDAKAIEEMATTSDKEELGRKTSDYPNRDEVVCYEVWIPEYTPEESPGESEGFHGAIFTLAVAASEDDDKLRARFIRKPRPYYGPRRGPYVMFGVYRVPDSIYPLSPLVALEGQVSELNAHAEAAAISAEKYKKLILVDDTDPKLPQRIKSEKDLFVIPVSGLERQRVLQAEIGGMTAQQLSYMQLSRDRLDRNSGISDAQRGTVEGRGTATENQIAAEAGTTRVAYLKQQFADAVQSVLERVAWFFYYDDRVAMPIGPEGAEAMGMEEPWLIGGDHDKDSGATFDDLELEIEPYSMERTTERTHQRNTLQMFEVLMNTAPAMPQMPWVNWKKVLDRIGDALNIPDVAEMVDVDMAISMAGAPPQEDPQQVRFNKDIGKAGQEAGKATPRIARGDSGPVSPDMNTLLKGQVSGIEASRAANAQMQ